MQFTAARESLSEASNTVFNGCTSLVLLGDHILMEALFFKVCDSFLQSRAALIDEAKLSPAQTYKTVLLQTLPQEIHLLHAI